MASVTILSCHGNRDQGLAALATCGMQARHQDHKLSAGFRIYVTTYIPIISAGKIIFYARLKIAFFEILVR